VNDNLITVSGNVVDSPRRVRLESGSVTNFRMACTKRRFDRARGEFVDGTTFWVDVECWGELGGNVSASVSKGDPVIVRGEISTREWDGEHGRRTAAQIRAAVVGPNLARGTADFRRTMRPAPAAADAGPAPAEASAEDEFSEDEFGGEQELRAGEDYIPDPSALHSTDSDEAILEPALR
jgi:single-strand DNA-binding protein